MKYAGLNLDSDELIALMYAIECAIQIAKMDGQPKGMADDLAAIHERIQSAWREIRADDAKPE